MNMKKLIHLAMLAVLPAVMNAKATLVTVPESAIRNNELLNQTIQTINLRDEYNKAADAATTQPPEKRREVFANVRAMANEVLTIYGNNHPFANIVKQQCPTLNQQGIDESQTEELIYKILDRAEGADPMGLYINEKTMTEEDAISIIDACQPIVQQILIANAQPE
jgi:hypothetical protein